MIYTIHVRPIEQQYCLNGWLVMNHCVHQRGQAQTIRKVYICTCGQEQIHTSMSSIGDTCHKWSFHVPDFNVSSSSRILLISGVPCHISHVHIELSCNQLQHLGKMSLSEDVPDNFTTVHDSRVCNTMNVPYNNFTGSTEFNNVKSDDNVQISHD